MTRRVDAAMVLCIVLIPVIAAAQDVDPKPTFEVASVRPNELGPKSFLLAFRNGRFTARYHTVKEFILSAYKLTDSQVFGAPSWLDVDRFGDLVWALSRPELVPGVGRPVVDRTGLTGTFDIDLRWTPDSAFTDRNQSAAPLPSLDGNEPPLFTAIQEQLGLKLERTKGPVDVLVIDNRRTADAKRVGTKARSSHALGGHLARSMAVSRERVYVMSI